MSLVNLHLGLTMASAYLALPTHADDFRAALLDLEDAALATVQGAVGGQLSPEESVAAVGVCAFFADLDGPLAGDFRDILDENAGNVLGFLGGGA